MKAIFTTSILVIAVSCVFAQTKVSGKVEDETGEPIPGANIFLENTYDGTTTAADGSFSFTSDEKGTFNLVVKFIGYADTKKEVVLNGSPVVVNLVMRETFNELEAVTISASSFTAGDNARKTTFRALDIATTAGATADIAGALNTLPGTQKVGESGRLFVRGGDGNETRIFIDGMLVLNAYGVSAPNTPSRGRFLPFMFKGTSFSTGGYSAEYGQALSSALVLDSKDKSELTRTDIGILSVGGDVTHTQVWDRASLSAKVQYTNIHPYFNLINQEIDWITPPSSIEGISAFRHDVGKNGMLKVYGNFNHASYSLYNHDIDDASLRQKYDLTNNYRYLNGAYKDVLNDTWSVRGGVSYTYNNNDTFLEKDHVTDVEKGLHAKTVFEGSLTDRIELRTGAEVIDRDYEYDIVPTNGNEEHKHFNETIAAGFVESDLYATNSFVARAGVRMEYNNLLNKAGVDPRISLAYRAGTNGNLSLAYGRFRQSPKNELLRENNALQSEKADHYILSYQLVENSRTFRAEVYYKNYTDLVKYNSDMTIFNNSGNGYAKGFELFWRDNKSFRNTDYWVSYSYLDTERDYLNFPVKATPSFASAHNFSVVYKYFFTTLKTQVGATYSFSSSRPYNNPNHDKFNADKTPVYHDVSLNISYLPRPNIIIYCSSTNLTGHDNIFGYEYSDTPNGSGDYNRRAIRQAAKRFIFIGVFITLSKQKSVNQLPSL